MISVQAQRHCVAGLAAVLLVSGGPATAQEGTGGLRGSVVAEGSGLTIPSALVAVDAGVRITSGADGRFRIDDLRAGAYRIAAVAPGCHVGIGEVEVRPGDATEVRLVVPLPEEAEALLQAWTLGNRSLGSSVRTITGEDIRRRNFLTVQDAIRVVAPDMIGAESAEAGGRQQVRGRGAPTVSGPRDPLVVVDGVRMLQRPWDALAALNPIDIERIEVARGATGGWRYGLAGANGVIRITTRHAWTGFDQETRPQECGFRFPR